MFTGKTEEREASDCVSDNCFTSNHWCPAVRTIDIGSSHDCPAIVNKLLPCMELELRLHFGTAAGTVLASTS